MPNSSKGPKIASVDAEVTQAAVNADGDLNHTLSKLGIVSVPSTRFEWGGYRYTNAADAIAAAKRAAAS